jgi:type I restriction enzyme, S subunit
MNANQFLSAFEHIAAAPGGISKVREIIINLAVHGELNTEGENNHTTSRQLVNEATELRHSGKIQGEQHLPEISESQVSRYPKTWTITRLGKVVYLVSGQHLSEEEQNQNELGIPYLTGASDFGVMYPVVTRWTSVRKSVAIRGDILIAVKGTIGKINFLNLECAGLGRQLMAVRALTIEPEFLVLILRSKESYFLAKSVGIAIPGISRKDILHLVVGIPSRDEQKRIVAKVNELIAQCNRLEAQQQECKTLHKLTRKTVFTNLATAKDSTAIMVAWNQIQDNFDLWLNDGDSITELRNIVSFLGCRGFLTKPSPFYITEPNGISVPLPTEWYWKTLKQLSEYITSGSRGWKRFIAPLGDIFIRSQDIKYDSLAFEEPTFVVLPEQVEGMRTLVRSGDLLMTITGANVGKCALVPQLTKKAYVSQHVALIRLRDIRHAPFLHWWITNTFGGKNHLAQYIYGDKPGLNLAQVGNIPIPFPPQEVQDRIVETLEHYRVLFDRLGSQVSEARNIAESLAAAAIASITGIQVEDKEKMKAPKTELISTLRVGVSPTNREQAALAAILIRNNGEMSAKTLWQTSGFEIDAFYQQLKTEMAKGWIVQPEVAHMREMEAS